MIGSSARKKRSPRRTAIPRFFGHKHQCPLNAPAFRGEAPSSLVNPIADSLRGTGDDRCLAEP
jgi:hypothetical protein